MNNELPEVYVNDNMASMYPIQNPDGKNASWIFDV